MSQKYLYNLLILRHLAIRIKHLYFKQDINIIVISHRLLKKFSTKQVFFNNLYVFFLQFNTFS